MNKEDMVKLIRKIMPEDDIRVDEPMSKHTTFKVGGPADVFITPRTKEQMSDVVKISREFEIPLFVLGHGSNLIVRDKGIRGIVMQMFTNYSDINVNGTVITAQGGALLAKVSHAALKNSLTGLEFASGIPGTLGGAVIMNAGAYGGEMKDVVVETEYIDEQGEIRNMVGDEHCFGYRTSSLQGRNNIILESTMQLKEGNYDEIKAVVDDLTFKRKSKQPLQYPSAGSVFKRPEGYFAGKLIEDSNLKGARVGGAQVSELHAGFIINNKNAMAQDILDLIKHVQNTVKANFGVELETEVKIVGEE